MGHSRDLTRRSVLAKVGALSAGFVMPGLTTRALHGAEQSADLVAVNPNTGWPDGIRGDLGLMVISGALAMVDSSTRTITLSSIVPDREPSEVRVHYDHDTTFWRDRPGRIHDFLVGDHLTVEGDWQDGAFKVQFMTAMYESRDDVVVSSRRGHLIGNDRTYLITPETTFLGPARTLDPVQPPLPKGGWFSVLYREEPATGKSFAFQVAPH